MRKYLLVFLTALLCLTGCQPAAVQPTQTALPTATDMPAPTLTAAPTEVVDYCVACHTDKEQLIVTAKPEEEKEAESSGVG